MLKVQIVFDEISYLRTNIELRRQVDQHLGDVLDHLHHQVLAKNMTCVFVMLFDEEKV